MTIVRILLGVFGLCLGGYAVTLLVEFQTRDLLSIALWFAGGVLVHDAVFAPICVALGLSARRILPSTWWGILACSAVCTVALLLIAAPVLGRGHAMPDNSTVLNRDYPWGLVAALVTVWALPIAGALVRRKSSSIRQKRMHPNNFGG